MAERTESMKMRKVEGWLRGQVGRRVGRRISRALAGVVALGAIGCAGPRMATTVEPPYALLATADAPELRLAVDEPAGEVVVDMGPFNVPDMGLSEDAGHGTGSHEMANGSGSHEMAEMADGTPATHGQASPLMRFEWPVEGWLRGFQVRVTDEDGNELPRHILHHLIGVNFDRRQLTYPALERFFGIGTETKDVELPSSIGVPMAEGQQLGFYASLHNDTGRDFDRVYVRIVMDYTSGARTADVTEVLPVYFDTDNRVGENNMWDVPPGRTEKAWEFTVPVSGGLLGVTGHLHDYGQHVRLEDAETGEVLVKLDGRRDDEGHLRSVEQRIFRKWLGLRWDPLRLEAGRRYRVVGVYESPLQETIVDGAMAHIVGVFAPDDMSRWPSLDPMSEWIQRDVSALPEASADGHGAHHRHE